MSVKYKHISFQIRKTIGFMIIASSLNRRIIAAQFYFIGLNILWTGDHIAAKFHLIWVEDSMPNIPPGAITDLHM